MRRIVQLGGLVLMLTSLAAVASGRLDTFSGVYFLKVAVKLLTER